MFQLKITNNKIIYGVIVFLGLAAVLFVSNNYQIQISEKPRKPIGLPPVLTTKCGIENCHGLDIACGQNIPEVCDMSYRLGDKCRRLASCQVISSTCQLVRSAELDTCKSCVENCERQFDGDPEKAFACESKCGPKAEESQ